MTRTRPTMADYHKARAFEWYEAHAEWFEPLGNGQWQVFPNADPYDHRTHSVHDSLGEAIKAARELVGSKDD